MSNDIQHWWPMLKPGGRLIGDDYRAGNDWPGVKRAFDDYFRPLGLLPLQNTDDKCIVAKPQVDLAANDRLTALKRTGTAVAAWRETLRLEHAELAEDETIGVEQRLQRFLRWEGPNWQPGLLRIINRIARDLRPGIREFAGRELFGAQGEFTAEIDTAIPGFSTHFLRPVPNSEFTRYELLAEANNPWTIFRVAHRARFEFGEAPRHRRSRRTGSQVLTCFSRLWAFSCSAPISGSIGLP